MNAITPFDNTSQFETVDNFVQIDFGTFWVSKEDNTIICMIKNIHMVEDVIHAVSISFLSILDEEKGELIKKHGNKVLIAEFLATYEPFEESEAMAGIESKYQQANKLLLALTSEFKEASAAPNLTGQNKLGLTADGSGTSVVELKSKTMENVQAVEAWEEKALSIKDNINSMVHNIQCIMEEKTDVVYAQLNRIKPVLNAAQQILFKSALYVGEGEEIINAGEGVSASEGDVIHLYRDILYMDEESLLNSLEGGASFRNILEFAELLKEDTAIRDRIAPFERCIVPMKASRADSEYNVMQRGLAKDYAEAYDIARKNRETWLLIRDGENVHLVLSSLKFIDHLFPSDIDFKQLEKRYLSDNEADEDVVLRDTLDYDKLHDNFKRLEAAYHSVALLLQGLHDRETGVLGKFSHKPNFMDFQKSMHLFKFIEQKNLLPENIGSFHDYCVALV